MRVLMLSCWLVACGGTQGTLTGSGQCPSVQRAALRSLHTSRGGIGGVVLDRHCRGAADVDVIVRSSAATDQSATTNETGRFLVDDLPRGVYDLIFIAEGSMWEVHDVAVRAGSVAHVQTQRPDPLELGRASN